MSRFVDIECTAVTEVIGRRKFESREDIQEFLDNIPTADVEEVRHGEWKINPDGYYPYCSECRYEPEYGNMTKYCPECGAKIEGGDQNGNKTIFEESIQTTRTD